MNELDQLKKKAAEDAKRINELAAELEQTRKILRDQAANPFLSSLDSMVKNMAPQVNLLEKKLEMLKMHEPELMDKAVLYGEEASIALTKGGSIIINFTEPKNGKTVFNKMRTK